MVKLRKMMLNLFGLALICTLLVLSGCGEQTKTLYIFNWTYYTPDSVIHEIRTGIRRRCCLRYLCVQ